jgi:CheY-like chemotaxis protein
MSKKILIVDNDSHMRLMLEHNLKSEGYLISSAEDGEQAFKIAKNDKPALIITDLNMPKMNGFDLSQKLKKDPETKHIPIILISGDIVALNKLRTSTSGPDDILTKPFRLEGLYDSVNSLLKS